MNLYGSLYDYVALITSFQPPLGDPNVCETENLLRV